MRLKDPGTGRGWKPKTRRQSVSMSVPKQNVISFTFVVDKQANSVVGKDNRTDRNFPEPTPWQSQRSCQE